MDKEKAVKEEQDRLAKVEAEKVKALEAKKQEDERLAKEKAALEEA